MMLYRQKYIISIYDKHDQLITVLDNAREFANYYEKTIDQAHSTLSRLFLKKRNSFYHENKQYFVAFIEN